MYRVIKIGDKEVPMLAMASVDIYYKQIFGEDILKVMTNAEKYDNADRVQAIQKMGFVMAKFCELKNRKLMLELNETDYWDWLEGFSHGALLDAYDSINALYLGQKIPESTEKNESDG